MEPIPAVPTDVTWVLTRVGVPKVGEFYLPPNHSSIVKCIDRWKEGTQLCIFIPAVREAKFISKHNIQLGDRVEIVRWVNNDDKSYLHRIHTVIAIGPNHVGLDYDRGIIIPLKAIEFKVVGKVIDY